MATFDWQAERADLPGLAQLDDENAEIDHIAVRVYRQARVHAEMVARGIDAVILSDAVNIRYATGTRNMQVSTSRNAPSRYLVMTATRAILFEFTGCEHLADGFGTVDEVRSAPTADYVAAGPEIATREKAWARETAALIAELTGGPGAKVGLERLNAGAALALAAEGLRLVDAREPVEMARSVKSAEEMKCVIASLRSTERGVAALCAAIRPGLTEAQLWSVRHASVIADNADYIETRLLNAGADQSVVPGDRRQDDRRKRADRTRYRRGRRARPLRRLLAQLSCRARRTHRHPTRALPIGARSSAPQHRCNSPRHELWRRRERGLGHSRQGPRQPVLPLGAWLRDDGRIPLPLPPRRSSAGGP